MIRYSIRRWKAFFGRNPEMGVRPSQETHARGRISDNIGLILQNRNKTNGRLILHACPAGRMGQRITRLPSVRYNGAGVWNRCGRKNQGEVAYTPEPETSKSSKHSSRSYCH